MKSRRIQRGVSASLALVILLFVAACKKEEPPTVLIGSGGMLGNYYSVAKAIARVVNEQEALAGQRLKQEPTTGSIENINRVLAGELTFGIAQADLEYQAANGLSDWDTKGPQSDLRAMFSLYPDMVTVVATLGSGITTLSDLVGKRVDLGHPESGSRQNAIDALEAAGIDWQQGIEISGDHPDERESKYLNGKIDAFFHTVGHPNMDIHSAVNSLPRARFIPLSNIADLTANHSYYKPASIAIDLYPGVGNQDDVVTVGVSAIFFTSAKVPDDVVYAVTRAIFNGLESVQKYDPVLKRMTKSSMLDGMSVPLHPGAKRFYEEAGLLPKSSASPHSE
jgi:TRAP transporter TAXI family solute receptor